MKKFSSLLITLILFFSIFKVNGLCYEVKDSDKNFDKKVVYITFDDGPNITTPKILDLLSKYDMKATFFLLENKIKSNPDIVKRILSEGHSIGLHGKTHEKKLFYANNSSALKEMNSTRNSLQKLIGYDTNLVRVPYGSKPHLTKNQYMSLIDNGYKLWDWNIDSTDTHPNASSNSISTHTINEVKNYKTPIILFHDKQVTVNALPSILEYLQNNSYIGKTITQEDIPLNWWN